MRVRQEKGLRPGGFGIVLASQVVDELIYNKQHNELIFVKYLDEPKQEKKDE
jgi:anti-sigma regulatory factor (Ser/Thr protein kinase)